jgi:hypothetical protein
MYKRSVNRRQLGDTPRGERCFDKEPEAIFIKALSG